MKKLLTIFFLLTSTRGFSQQPIYATGLADSLFSFNLTNCTKHLTGITSQGFLDIAFTPDGQLWGINGWDLYHIDTATANTTLVGNMGINPVSLVGFNDTTLFGEYLGKLYGINTNTASSYYIDTIGYNASGDLTWYDDDLYIVTSTIGSPIIKIVLDSTYTAILSVTQIGWNIPVCEAAVTASFLGDYNSIVGFPGPNLIKICQIDGSHQTLCPNLHIGPTGGAASIRLSTQVPQPTICSITGIQNISPNNLFSIFPNPAANEISIQTIHNQKFNFNIYNSLGQKIKAGVFEANAFSININNLANGIYNIELTADGKTERKCFIVDK